MRKFKKNMQHLDKKIGKLEQKMEQMEKKLLKEIVIMLEKK